VTRDSIEAGIAQGTKSRRALVLVNPGKRDAAGLNEALGRLAAGGVGIEVRDLDPGAAGASLHAASGRCQLIVVSGGDGTLHRAAPLLIEEGLPVGILPTGTANDLARTLAIPPDPVRAADVILAGHTKTIDLGEVNGHPYFNVASIGMTVDLTVRLTGETKRRWGRAAYALTALKVALSAAPFTARIVGGGETIETRTLQIAVGNGRYYGGGMAVDEGAAIDDGHLHLYSLEMQRALAMLPMLWSFRRGTHGRWASVRTLIGDEFTVTTRRARPVSADGEIITATPCTFRVLPRALRVFVPRSDEAGAG